MKLQKSFYLTDDVLEISKKLLGKLLCTKSSEGIITKGKIVETEAYDGITDRASHAYKNKITDRTRVMFQEGGISYVYLCYGIHHLFNIITGPEHIPHAVLIRAIEPVSGIDQILARRNQKKLDRKTGGGPGIVSQALGITVSDNTESLQSNRIWLEESKVVYHEDEIIASPRVGVDYAGDDAKLPWRFRVKSSSFTSPAK